MNAITLHREARLDALNTSEMVSEGAIDLARRLSNAADAIPESRKWADAQVLEMEARWAANRAATGIIEGKRA